jgi:hypothetical protein
VSGPGIQLHDLLDAAVGEPPRHVDLVAVRRRVRRRRWTELAAAVVACALVATVGVTVLTHVSAPGAGPLSAASVHAGQPAYYIQQMSTLKSPLQTRVRATASGKVTATVHCSWRGASIPPGGIAPAGHGVFFATCEQGTDPEHALKPNASQTRLYRFRVTTAGQVTGFSLVKGGNLGRFSASSLTVTPGGAEAAVVLGPPGANSTGTDGVLVINTRTGAQAMWRMGGTQSGLVLAYVGDLSLTSDGRELAFLTDTKCPAVTAKKGCTRAREIRAVSPALAGGQLTSSRFLFRGTELRGQSTGYINDAGITPDGSALTIAVIHSAGRGSTLVRVIQVSARTGQQLRVVYQVDTGNGMSYRYFSSDPAGRYLMLDAGPSSESHNGWIYHGRLVALKPYDGDNVRWQTW